MLVRSKKIEDFVWRYRRSKYASILQLTLCYTTASGHINSRQLCSGYFDFNSDTGSSRCVQWLQHAQRKILLWRVKFSSLSLSKCTLKYKWK